MTNPRKYRMSSFGGCPRAAVAAVLGYDRQSRGEGLERAARAGTRHETWLEQDLAEQGFKATPPQRCNSCGAGGIHTEMSVDDVLLVGHVDRVATTEEIDNYSGKPFKALYMIEEKALAKERAASLRTALKDTTLFVTQFRSYAYQVSAYHHAIHLPILYMVKERESERVTVHRIPPPISLEDIIIKVKELEFWAGKDEVPPCDGSGFERAVCAFPYLCGPSVVTPRQPAVALDNDMIFYYKELRDQKKALEQQMDEIEGKILALVKQTGKAEGAGLRFAYMAPGINTTYPRQALEALVPEDMLAKVREVKERKEYLRVTEIKSTQ